MIILGILLLALAAVAAVELILGNEGKITVHMWSWHRDIDAFWLAVAGAVLLAAALLGLAMLKAGSARARRLRRERRELAKENRVLAERAGVAESAQAAQNDSYGRSEVQRGTSGGYGHPEAPGAARQAYGQSEAPVAAREPDAHPAAPVAAREADAHPAAPVAAREAYGRSDTAVGNGEHPRSEAPAGAGEQFGRPGDQAAPTGDPQDAARRDNVAPANQDDGPQVERRG